MKHPIKSTLLAVYACALVACGGGGDDNGTPTGNVTISGAITFDRVPFKTLPAQGLNFGGTIESPARNVVVEALDASNSSILATTTTDTAGLYSLQVSAGRSVIVRAKAQMLKTGAAPTWNFRVLNNTNADALYTLDSAAFTTSGNSTRNLRATSGWGATSYTEPRAAAPFAILDTIYQVKSLILTAKSDTVFPVLDLYWSTQNRPSATLCPDTGDVVSSLYISFGTSETDECSTPTLGVSGIYILGNFQVGDTDEFDQHVIAHEAGHYFENKFSRSDSMGGDHSTTSKLDLRVAFGEGWGDAFGAMALNDPVYRDSQGGIGQDFGFNLESETISPANRGWFSEPSVFKFLWDVFDPANESGDTVSLGFGPIYQVMTGSESTTNALTSIFPFANALKLSNSGVANGIDALLAEQGIAPVQDDFGSAEVVGGANVVPIYTSITSPGTIASLCGSAANGEYNKLSNRRLVVYQSPNSHLINIHVAGPAGSDPDFVIWRRGISVFVGQDENSDIEDHQIQVAAGTYVIEIYDYNHVDRNSATGTSATCMSVAVAG